MDRLADAEFDARADLAELPVASSEQFLEKLRYLLEVEWKAWGHEMVSGRYDLSEKYGSIVAAIYMHMNQEATS